MYATSTNPVCPGSSRSSSYFAICATQLLRAVLMQRESSNLTREPRPVLEHDGEVRRECAATRPRNARKALEVSDRARHLGMRRRERHFEGRDDINGAVVGGETVKQPVDALAEVHGWSHAQPVVKSSSRVGGVEAATSATSRAAKRSARCSVSRVSAPTLAR